MGWGPSLLQRPPALRVQPHARLSAALSASLFPGSAMASSSVLMGRMSSVVSWGGAGTHLQSRGGLGGCAMRALRGPGALGCGVAGQARDTLLLAGSSSGSCVAPCRDLCAPELLGDVWGMGTDSGSYAEQGSPPPAREPCWVLLWVRPLAPSQHLPLARTEGSLVVVPER